MFLLEQKNSRQKKRWPSKTNMIKRSMWGWRSILFACTSPSVSGVSPLWLGPSSAEPQWYLAFSSSCTARGYPCTEPGSVYWSATAARKTQNPAITQTEWFTKYISSVTDTHTYWTPHEILMQIYKKP